MELAGKYANNQPGYTPDVFPDQRLMQAYANQTTNPQLRAAALQFQYPFKISDLKNSNYTDEIKYTIMQATIGTMG